ncbi:hypothetical protein F0U44_05285 [Nocardioides humilatus]|uniref:Integral membrane protein n=1 Tax=Nocardioides humilatus TaxID=2607660 RepID=A0A5B1LPV4_9ACTN|nr:hypothetical protein [Nocardioides humilatus]KAA1421689.1 hypothetical protein F0U44_05285 [Nocardioides humilatus]
MSRHALAAFAVVLATLLVPLGIGASWLSLRIDNTDSYVDTVAPLADNAELRSRLADEVANAAVATLTGNLPIGLPDMFGDMVRTSAKQVVESDSFPEFWRKANAHTHREFLAIVHDEKGVVDTDGWVVVDLRPLLDDVLADVIKDLRLPISADALPKTPVPMPVIRESDLERGRGLYQLLDALALWVPLLWAGLVLVAVLAGTGWRGRLRTAAAAAIGVAVGGVLVLLGLGPLTDAIVDQVEPEKQDLARLVIETVLDTLHGEAFGAVLVGLVVGAGLIVVSLLPGRSRASYA